MCAISPNAYSKDLSVSVCTCRDACSDDKVSVYLLHL